MVIFNPDFKVVNNIAGTYPAEDLLSQQGMFAADWDFAREHSNPILLKILDAIPQWYHDDAAERGMELNIDVRVHELRKGEFPATPGWHCDAPQRETEFSKSSNLTDVANSLVCNVSSCPDGVSNTVFCKYPVELDDDSMTQKTWDMMNKLLGPKLIPEYHYFSRDGQLAMFSPMTPHCIQPTQNDGVRMFVRVSQWVKPDGFTPGLTHCEQVYRSATLQS